MDLVRLALERSTTAAEAVERDHLAARTPRPGRGLRPRAARLHVPQQLPGGRPARGRRRRDGGHQWAVERVTSGARSISNGLTIPGFAERHADRVHTALLALPRVAGRSPRRAPARATGVGDLMAVLRDHGTGGGARTTRSLTGAMGGPVHARRRPRRRVADDGVVGRRARAGGLVALGHRHRRAVHRAVQAGVGSPTRSTSDPSRPTASTSAASGGATSCCTGGSLADPGDRLAPRSSPSATRSRPGGWPRRPNRSPLRRSRPPAGPLDRARARGRAP